MPGVGRPPKDPSQRRNRNQPRRGDWVTLTPLDNPVVPDMPAPPGEAWSERSIRSWENWWKDPASQMWVGSDVDLVEHLLFVHERWVIKGTAGLLSELRYLRESLGLTPKGKQDRRWKVQDPAEVHDIADERTRAAERRRDREATRASRRRGG